MNKFLRFLFVLSIPYFISCATSEPFYNERLGNWEEEVSPAPSSTAYSVFLIGDSRRAYQNERIMQMMETQLGEAGKNSAVVFLGDNAQPSGLPDDSTHRHWETAEKSLIAQLEILKGYKGEIIYLPGNHDWARGGKDGLEFVKNQRKYIHEYLDKKDVFLPKKGRPGPEEIKLSNDIVLIVFDSQWWFHENEKSYAGIIDEADLFVQLEDAISRNKEKKIIIATHHPLFSVGNHGGHFPGSSLLFPLLEANNALWIPLPGFLYTGYRKFLGAPQDLAHPHYKMLREALLETFEGHSNIIYAAGHEHNLQYVEKDSNHHIVSGAAGMATYAAQSKKTDFSQMQTGFAKLSFHENGDVWLEFFTTESSDDPAGHLAFKKKIFNKPVYDKKQYKEFLSDIDYSDSTITTYPNGEKIRVWYRGPHPQVSAFDDVIDGRIEREVVIQAVIAATLDWNNSRIRGGDKFLLSRSNKAEQELMQAKQDQPIHREPVKSRLLILRKNLNTWPGDRNPT